MPTAQTVFSRIWTLASLCALLGAAAIVLYFLSPGYGFADRDITPYYWGSVGLDGGIFLLCLPLIRLSRRLPEKAPQGPPRLPHRLGDLPPLSTGPVSGGTRLPGRPAGPAPRHGAQPGGGPGSATGVPWACSPT